jgi:hypothetical protein
MTTLLCLKKYLCLLEPGQNFKFPDESIQEAVDSELPAHERPARREDIATMLNNLVNDFDGIRWHWPDNPAYTFMFSKFPHERL